MSLELSTNYISGNYSKTNINNKTSVEKSDSTASSKSTTELSSDNKSSSVDEYYKKLCSKFPNLKFQAGLGDLKPGKIVPPNLKGLGNVRIDSKYLQKVANDPKMAEDLEKKLEYEPSADAWLKSMYAMQGKKVVATVTGIDANGDFFSGSITEPINSDSNSYSKSKKKSETVSKLDLNEMLKEKYKKLKEQKEAQAKRLVLMTKESTNTLYLQKKAAKNYNANLFNNFNMNLVDSNK